MAHSSSLFFLGLVFSVQRHLKNVMLPNKTLSVKTVLLDTLRTEGNLPGHSFETLGLFFPKCQEGTLLVTSRSDHSESY